MNDTVTPVAVPDRSKPLTVTDSDGDGLIDSIPFVAGSGARAFPARNGIFTVKEQAGTVSSLTGSWTSRTGGSGASGTPTGCP